MDTQLCDSTDQFNTRGGRGKRGKGERSLRNLIFGSTAREKSDDGSKVRIISENLSGGPDRTFCARWVGRNIEVDSSILRRKLYYLRVRVLAALEHFAAKLRLQKISIYSREI